ncbi:MAG: DUF411 domain-containing protein [Magnetococcales bacterium]|nr:DUF411 domain-containing protein [Magnetococcales bacterium]MBF0152044.1 DUF411 domain-containing protein [Magnetococcales bacterium]
MDSLRKKIIISLLGLGLLLIAAWWFMSATPAGATDLLVYKSPSCGCCGEWVKHMEQNGFRVQVRHVEDMTAIKRQQGVPPAMESCHTAVIGDYLVEGHVPAADVRRMLAEHPPIQGIAAPGMPTGSPGMEVPGQKPEPYQVFSFTRDEAPKVFANH